MTQYFQSKFINLKIPKPKLVSRKKEGEEYLNMFFTSI